MRLTLYDHAIQHRPAVRLLSRDGNRNNAQIIPKSLTNVISHDVTLSRPFGEPVTTMICDVATWKVKDVGWLTSPGQGQGALDLAHGKTPSMQGGSSA